MSSASEEYSAGSTPQSDSLIDRIIGVFVSPRPTMDNISARPNWLLPLIIVTIVGTVSGYLLSDVILQTAIDQMSNNANMTPEQVELARPRVEQWTRITAWASPLVFTPVFYLILAGVFMFVGNVMLGGAARYKTLFSVVCWSALITVISSLINVPVMRSRGAMESATNLAFLAPEGETQSLLYFFLSQIDLFTIWWLIVLGLGLAAANRFSNEKGVTTVFVLWALYLGVAVGFKALFS